MFCGMFVLWVQAKITGCAGGIQRILLFDNKLGQVASVKYGSGNQVVFYRQSGSLGAVGGIQFMQAGADMVPGCGGADH